MFHSVLYGLFSILQVLIKPASLTLWPITDILTGLLADSWGLFTYHKSEKVRIYLYIQYMNIWDNFQLQKMFKRIQSEICLFILIYN